MLAATAPLDRQPGGVLGQQPVEVRAGAQPQSSAKGVAGRPSASATAGLATWPASGVEPAGQGRVGGRRPPPGPVRGELDQVGQGGVGQGVGRRVGHGAGHVADARSGGRRGPRRRGRRGSSRGWSRCSRPGRWRRRRSPRRASCPRTMSSVTTHRRPAAGRRARRRSTRSASATDRSTAPRLEASVMMRPWWIWSTQRRRSRFWSSRTTSASMPWRDPRRVPADVAGAEHHDPGRPHARARRRAARPGRRCAARGSGRRSGCAMRPGHLAHRGQQRQRPVGQLHRLVGDAGRTRRSSRALATSG